MHNNVPLWAYAIAAAAVITTRIAIVLLVNYLRETKDIKNRNDA